MTEGARVCKGYDFVTLFFAYSPPAAPPRGSPLSEGANDKHDGEGKTQRKTISVRVFGIVPSHPTSSGALPQGEPFGFSRLNENVTRLFWLCDCYTIPPSRLRRATSLYTREAWGERE